VSSTPDPIRVIVADDHAVVRAGLAAILEAEPDVRVVAEVGDGRQAIAAYLDHRPDVLVMDLRMPVLDGLGALVELRRTDPAARVILLTTYDDEEDIYRGLEAGASGYLLKDAAAGELVDGIRKVYSGRKAIAPAAAERLAGRVAARELSDREREVLELLAEGKSNKQIARALGISDGTVKVHVANILHKLGAQGRSEAVAVAARRGLVRLG
jgi:two-component system, NarL family, response regulator